MHLKHFSTFSHNEEKINIYLYRRKVKEEPIGLLTLAEAFCWALCHTGSHC